MAVTFEFEGKSFEEKLAIRDNLIAYMEEHYPYEKVVATLEYETYGNRKTYSQKRRISLYKKDIFVYAKGKKSWGNYLNATSGYLLSVTIPEKRKSKAEIWEDSWKTVIKYLEKSGLWEKSLEEYKLGLDIGYEKIKEADRLYWKNWDERIEEVRKIDERLITLNSEGKEIPNTNIIWYMSRPKAEIKTIYFGKYGETERVREELKTAFKNKEDYCESAQVPNYYDVRVDYQAKYNRAWYSEEYRDCGNGHYYILLDEKHALFAEDD